MGTSKQDQGDIKDLKNKKSGEMGGKTLGELLKSLDLLDSQLTIFAEKIDGEWVPSSLAWLGEPVDGPVPPNYFLEVEIAMEVVEDWIKYQLKRKPTPEELVSRIIYYATNDA